MTSQHLGLSNVSLIWDLLKQTAAQWSQDKIPRHGAALAYYTVFSIVPLLVIIIAMVGLVFGQDAAQSYILQQLGSLLGEQSTAAIKDMIQRASQPSTGVTATLVAFATLLFGASGLFGQLQDSLNSIWGVEPKARGMWGIIQDRFFSFIAVVGTGFLLLVSLVLSAGLAAFGKWSGGWLPASEFILQMWNVLLSFAVITALFAMMFKVLPDARVAWRDVWIGAALTALLFTIGKFSIGLYLGKSDVGSAYGAAGSLAILLVWVYYSAQILLFGAEFTQVYANKAGARIVPTHNAVAVDPEKAVSESPGVGAKDRTEPSGSIDEQRELSLHAIGRIPTPHRASAAPSFRHEFGWLGVGLVVWSLIKTFRNERTTERL
ncbi:MAG: YihY/virulence factor BrkB family protein [Nitrospira sp.]